MRTSGRPLTPAEVTLARSVFGSAIDYAPVRLHRRRWWPLQPRHICMAPDGDLWFHPYGPLWCEDFSLASLSLQALFVHEMTHVWQSQTRGRFYLMLMRHPFCRYDYSFRADRPFERYGLEQQAEIVRHVFLLRRGHRPSEAPALEALEAILPFRSD